MEHLEETLEGRLGDKQGRVQLAVLPMVPPRNDGHVVMKGIRRTVSFAVVAAPAAAAAAPEAGRGELVP